MLPAASATMRLPPDSSPGLPSSGLISRSRTIFQPLVSAHAVGPLLVTWITPLPRVSMTGSARAWPESLPPQAERDNAVIAVRVTRTGHSGMVRWGNQLRVPDASGCGTVARTAEASSRPSAEGASGGGRETGDGRREKGDVIPTERRRCEWRETGDGRREKGAVIPTERRRCEWRGT